MKPSANPQVQALASVPMKEQSRNLKQMPTGSKWYSNTVSTARKVDDKSVRSL